jgi:DNA-directed RNA polymerase subunit E'/Rpb7
MSLFRPVYMDQRVALSPTEFRDAAADVDAYLLKKLRKRLEEQCCTHGYVRGGSTQILARSMGQAEHCRFTGDFLYHCKVRVLCYLPEAGQTVDAQVLMANKAGAYALLVDQGRVTEAMRIFLPRDFHLGNTAFDELQKGSVVRVRILRSRFKANDPFINVAGVFLGASTVEVTGGPKKLKSVVAPTEGGAAADDQVEEYEVTETAGGELEFGRAAEATKVKLEEGAGDGGFTVAKRVLPALVPKEEAVEKVNVKESEGGFTFTQKPAAAAAEEGKAAEEEEDEEAAAAGAEGKTE